MGFGPSWGWANLTDDVHAPQVALLDHSCWNSAIDPDMRHRVSKYRCIRTYCNSALDKDQQWLRVEVKRRLADALCIRCGNNKTEVFVENKEGAENAVDEGERWNTGVSVIWLGRVSQTCCRRVRRWALTAGSFPTTATAGQTDHMTRLLCLSLL